MEEVHPSKSQQSSENELGTMAARFRYARSLVSMTRTAFCKKHDLNYNTVQSWEIERSNSREGNVTKFCEALAQEGIICTEDWLFDGIGPKPALPSTKPVTVFSALLTERRLKNKPSQSQAGTVQDEVLFFLRNCQNNGIEAVAIQIPDEAMCPDYAREDYVGAQRVPFENASKLNQSICLIETIPHHFLVRELLIEGDKFILLPSNKAYPVLSFDSLTSVSAIVWKRRAPNSFLE